MSREIKFRAWHKPSLQMVDVSDLAIKIGVINQGHNNMPFSEIELMQYTGLKDKNGKEIYEGDILIGVWNNVKSSIVFANGGFEWNNEPLGWDYESGFNDDKPSICHPEKWAEIIGNIYQNPELLKA